ncbi:MAG: hypothetical protein ACR2QF_03135 [Geminicoccaceae bacterium]
MKDRDLWHRGIDWTPRKERRRNAAKKQKAFKARQRELFVKELTTPKTMVGENYKPDPARAGECPWDE